MFDVNAGHLSIECCRGNTGGKPFRKGEACSECMYNFYENGYRCNDGLCGKSANTANIGCEVQLAWSWCQFPTNKQGIV